jgi:hypothetical protein
MKEEILCYFCGIPSYNLDSSYDYKYESSYSSFKRFYGPPGYQKKFVPPYGYTAIALNVKNLYGDTDWLGNGNTNREWYIGYHGVKSSYAIKNISEQGFIKGPGQCFKSNSNINSLTNSLYPLCGEGSYFAQDINTASSYCSYISYNGKNYKVVFMCRINPYLVRITGNGYGQDIMIAGGGTNTKNEVRPYKILITY